MDGTRHSRIVYIWPHSQEFFCGFHSKEVITNLYSGQIAGCTCCLTLGDHMIVLTGCSAPSRGPRA